MTARRLHIIANAHVDPVWIWSRRSGRNAWLNTIASNVALLKEFPEAKFVCSASALYRWVEECAPALFRDLRALVKEGRWEIVGGWEVQSDAILARMEPLLRQSQIAKEYFQERFGVEVKVGYNVDAFGHSAGLPQILENQGFTHYCFMRPQMPSTPLFRWRGPDASQVTCLNIKEQYGTDYATSEADFYARLDHFMETGEGEQTLFFGVGDHGGGLYRKHLEWFRSAAKRYPMQFSTLGEYFKLIDSQGLPEIQGELGPVFRGCYSACHPVKESVARTTRRLIAAEKLGARTEVLDSSWKELLFSNFHDSLPGTCIRSTYEKDVLTGLGGAQHLADECVDRALTRQSVREDTRFMTQGGIAVWNPHPFEHQTIVSFTNFSDPNATGRDFQVLKDSAGTEYPIQYLPTPTAFGPCGRPWQQFAAVVPVVPAGTRFLALGYSEQAFPDVGFEKLKKLHSILSLPVFYDNTRTWGFGMANLEDNFLGEMTCEKVEEFQNGPVCAILRSFWRWKDSTVQLELANYHGISEIGIQARIDWHETRTALKLAFDHGLAKPFFAVGEASALVRKLSAEDYSETDKRLSTWRNGRLEPFWPQSTESVFVDWCAATDGKRAAMVYAPDLHSVDHAWNKLRITLLRTALYADHYPFAQNEYDGWMDTGVLFRKLWYGEAAGVSLEEVPRLAAGRLENGEVIEVTCHPADNSVAVLPPRPCFSAKTTVCTSARLQPDGAWLLTLKNYGLAETLRFNDGTSLEMPAGHLAVFRKN